VEGVTEYDAFGNPIEPRPATATATVAPTATPTPAPAPAPAPLTTPVLAVRTYGPSKTTWGERLLGLLIFLVCAAPVAVGGYVAYTALHTAKDVTDVATALPSTLQASTAPAAPARAASAPSMLSPGPLARALRTARRQGGRLALLRVAAARVDLQLARAGGGLDLLQLRADGARTLVRTPGTAGGTIPFARVDVHAPGRLVRAAAHRLHRSPKTIDYVVLMSFDGAPRWSAYFTGGAAFQGDAHGRITRRIQ
jgi:hypothetical protein